MKSTHLYASLLANANVYFSLFGEQPNMSKRKATKWRFCECSSAKSQMRPAGCGDMAGGREAVGHRGMGILRAATLSLSKCSDTLWGKLRVGSKARPCAVLPRLGIRAQSPLSIKQNTKKDSLLRAKCTGPALHQGTSYSKPLLSKEKWRERACLSGAWRKLWKVQKTLRKSLQALH